MRFGGRRSSFKDTRLEQVEEVVSWVEESGRSEVDWWKVEEVVNWADDCGWGSEDWSGEKKTPGLQWKKYIRRQKPSGWSGRHQHLSGGKVGEVEDIRILLRESGWSGRHQTLSRGKWRSMTATTKKVYTQLKDPERRDSRRTNGRPAARQTWARVERV